jgi:hypothetical protein
VRSTFRAQSLVVRVDGHAAPDVRLLTHPAGYFPQVSRVVLHETVHYWQLLSRPFLWSMAVEDLERLAAFEDGGVVAPPGPLRCEFSRVDPSAGMSAEMLHEAVARYWDVQVLGPHRLLDLERADPDRVWDDDVVGRYEQARDAGLLTRADGSYSDVAFDLAMDAAAGHYARPYRMLRQRAGPREAAAVFPLAGALAFTCRRPVWLFLELLRAGQDLSMRSEDVHALWRMTWPVLCQRAAGLLGELGEDLTWHRPGLAGCGEPRTPLHTLVAARRAAFVSASGDDDALPPGGVAGLVFSTVGDPASRGTLVRELPPPVVVLGADRWVPDLDLRDVPRRVPGPDDPGAVAALADDLDQRWTRFTRAGLRSGIRVQEPADVVGERALAAAVDALLRSTARSDERHLSWLVEVLADEPEPLGFEAFCDRHLQGTFVLDDVNTLLPELASQLTSHPVASGYDAARGVVRTWSGSLVEVVLMTALLERAAWRIGLPELADLARALQLRALERFGAPAIQPPLGALAADRVAALSAAVPLQALRHVDAALVGVPAGEPIS